MTEREAFNGKPYAGNPHVRFDEWEVAPATPRRGFPLYTQTQSGKRRSCRFLRTVISLAAVLLAGAALSPLHADEQYQFFVSGYPAADVNYSAASSGTSLETATRTDRSVASQLEARYRTWDGSDGIALRSDKYRTFFIIVK